MNFQLNEQQSDVIAAVQAILRDHSELPQSARLKSYWFNEELQQLLTENGYLNVGREFGALEAALVVIECAKLPVVTEVAASSLVAPHLLVDETVAGPFAILSWRDLLGSHRNLPIARHALIEIGDDVAVVPVDPGNVESIPSILAYPFGRFKRAPDLSSVRRLRRQSPKLRQWWRVAVAAECAGAALAAVGFTVNHVKQRHVFGHPVAAFQAVQHRLVQCHMAATALYYLVLRAAWSGLACDADVAACYAQQHIKKIVIDLHQFTGAMGVTNEFDLHRWTYRLRALQTEVGGAVEAALDVARYRWEVEHRDSQPHLHVSGEIK
jgi:hypothetical protein